MYGESAGVFGRTHLVKRPEPYSSPHEDQHYVIHLERMVEQRQHTRLAVQYQASFSAPLGSGEGFILDLSLQGCCMRTTSPVPVRSYLQLRLMPSHTDTPILIDLAAVRWVRGQECGIHFLSLRPDQQERLARLIDLLHMKNALLE
jgi:hypothetical protein